MKKITWNQVKGLTWFIIVYALVRFILFFPILETQNRETFVIYLSAMTIAWLVFTNIRSEQAYLGLSVSVAIITSAIYLTWGDFNSLLALWVLIIMGVISLISVIVTVVYRMKNHKEWLIPLLLHLFGTITVFLLMEYLVLPLMSPLV